MGKYNIGLYMRNIDNLISVIIPVYNVEEYIEECLDSILAQTYKNIEIIIVNDGSQDKSEQIINNYLELNKNIVYLKQENSGQAKARNLALEYATGKYVIFIDSDDFLELDALEKMYKKINQTDSDVCIGSYYKYYSNSNKEKYMVDGNNDKLKGIDVIDYVLNSRIHCLVSFKLIKKELLDKVNFKFEVGRLYEDFFPIFKTMVNSNNIAIVNEPIFYYRQRFESSTRAKRISKIDDYFHASKLVLDYINVNYNEVVKGNSLNNFKVSRFSYMINLITRNVEYKDRYNYLKKKNYEEVELNFNRIIFSGASIKDKILCLLWKFRMMLILDKILN